MTESSPDSVEVRLRYPDVETFVERFGPNVTRGGVFLATRHPRPVGSMISFELQLEDGRPVLAGQGKVAWTRPYDPAQPERPYGIGLQFTDLQPAARDLVDRVLRIKAAMQAMRAGAPAANGTAARAKSESHDNGRSDGGNGQAHAASDVSGDDGGARSANGDLAAELGVDEASIRRILDHRRRLSTPSPDEDLTELLRREPPEPVTLAQALGELPRLLGPGARRRSGAARTLEALRAADRAAVPRRRAGDEPDTARADASDPKPAV